MGTTRTEYRAAHRLARVNRRAGRWLHNPVRLTEGYPGLWVGADGRVAHLVMTRLLVPLNPLTFEYVNHDKPMRLP